MTQNEEVIQSNIGYYRDEAEKCRSYAETASSLRVRSKWRRLGKTFEALAEQLANIEDLDGGAHPIGQPGSVDKHAASPARK
jgi:hypothetical protein